MSVEYFNDHLRKEAAKCPNCSCYLDLHVRVKTGSENIIQWFKRCSGCHAEFILQEELKE
jgi:rRNA maturation endonuclease Nob1